MVRNILKDKPTQIVLMASLINMGIIFLVTGFIDFPTIAMYLTISWIVVEFFRPRKLDAAAFFIIGAAIPAIYNGAGYLLNLFDVTVMFILIAAIEQAIVTWATYSIVGTKK